MAIEKHVHTCTDKFRDFPNHTRTKLQDKHAANNGQQMYVANVIGITRMACLIPTIIEACCPY